MFYRESYRIAEALFKEASGLMYVSYGKGEGLPVVELADGTGRLFFVDLNEVPFVYQKKGESFYPSIEAIFAKEGIDRSIEIKTLFLIHPERDSGRGFGSLLLKRVERYATEYFQAKGVHVTVSEMQKDSVGFFQKKGFKEMARWEGKYQKGQELDALFASDDF